MAQNRLAAYRAKRDFSKTAEPSGEAGVTPSKRLRFVVQKHAATRLHYDFRLEFDGAMKSWAVTKGPSLDPQDKRLAVEVEDHPLDYGDFEGVIPKGQYGGGTVMLWDRGYWSPQGDVETGLKKGELKFTLEGERLSGSWVIVRMNRDRERGKRTNWLLIKHADSFARPGEGEAFLEAEDVSVASGRSMEKIAAGEGPGPTPFISAKRARGKAAVWNSDRAAKDPEGPDPAKSRPKPRQASGRGAAKVPAFVPPQLCRSVDRPPEGDAWAHEIKFDGYRMQLRVENGSASLKTRKGLDWSRRFPEIVEEGAGLPDCLVDGEAVALDAEGAPDFPKLQEALSRGDTGGLVFYAFDLLHDRGEDLTPLPLRERKARLEAMLPTGLSRLRYVEHFQTGGEAILHSACRMQLEGIVSKRLDAPYISGRSESWTKAKCRGGQEVVVAGWTSQAGNPLRSLIAAVHRDGRLVHVGRIGTGFSRAKVDAILPRLKALETDRPPFDGPAPRKTAGVHWVRPELVAEIESGGWTGSGALRQASFKALREDKPAREVVIEKEAPVREVEAEAEAEVVRAKRKPAGAGARADRGGAIMGVRLSNPDKVLWPPAGAEPAHTKLDLARYYEVVAPFLMPHIEGRPCSIVRSPDGIEGQRFFQRHLGAGTSNLLTDVTVWGDRKPYLQVDRPEALIALAQSGALELHPWNCLPGEPEIPGRLVFDLDPGPDVPFASVVAAAKEVRDRLEAVGLQTFCKTTGGKGLHVTTPLAAEKKPLTWPEAKGFARALCEAMAADSPDRYVVNMAKAKRGGRIFLDYLRNDRMSTAVAPFSPRAREGAPVAWPLRWEDVKKSLDPMSYTLRTAPPRLGRLRAWSGYREAARSLRAAMAKLDKA